MIIDFLTHYIELMIGIPGRWIYGLITDHYLIFLLLIGIYGLLMLYTKYILRVYLPRRMDRLVRKYLNRPRMEDVHKTHLVEQIYKEWQEELNHFPFYIIVPSRNEFWFRRLNADYKQTQLLPYGRVRNDMKNDKELISERVASQLPI